jgi:hypothetical protein
METPDFDQALSLFSGSQDQFDLWFKHRLADSTGLNLSTPPSGPLPELLSSYSAQPQPSAEARQRKASAGTRIGTAAQVPQRAERPSRPPAWSSRKGKMQTDERP